jgi:plasmid stabilization system protein ParE
MPESAFSIARIPVQHGQNRCSASGGIRVQLQSESAFSLVRNAHRGRIVPEFNHPSKRELFVFRYRLIYAVSPDRVTIEAFLHGARDFARWRQDKG